ncbi:MAG: hydrogenase maturation nickel metallochaperone HypA [Leptolyngbyaceae cyanobacterium SM2_3_12]|nr:hydrogenase maturation nickel metallochaperone HypA [Leptolyngbyaceae cyanobacterium SM2_3_12]
MHELALTQTILETVLNQAQGATVQRVILEIGQLSAVQAEAIRFCFEACVPGTPLAATRLEIIEVPGRGRCRHCGHEMALDIPFGVCEVCDSLALDLIAGQDLMIKSMEIAQCA